MAIERLFIGEGLKEVEVKNYLENELKRAGLAGITIQRTPLVTRIVLYCDRPAIVIGRKGKNVKQITRIIEEDYKIEKPELEIKKIEKPNLEPAIVAYRIASALERGMNSRKVGYKALKAIMRDGAKGAEIILSGKLVGKGGRARSLKMKAGYMKKCGQPSLEQVMAGNMIATCKAGTIGVEVRIVPQNVHFPDEINIIKPEDFEITEDEVAEEKKEKASKKPVEKSEKKDSPKKAEEKQGKKEKPTEKEKEKGAEKKKETKPVKKKEEKKTKAPKEDNKEEKKPNDKVAKKETPKEEKKPNDKVAKKETPKEEKKEEAKKESKKE